MTEMNPASSYFQRQKNIIAPWQQALVNLQDDQAREALVQIAGNARFLMCHPFGDIEGAETFYDTVFVPLIAALPDIERRDYIVMAGKDKHGKIWVGTAGYYTGTFLASWLDIPPNGHQVHLRFHEFYHIEDNQVIEVQAIWDIPSLMMQVNAWPMSPSLGLEWLAPAPATQDGLMIRGSKEQALGTGQHILDMLDFLVRHPQEPPQAMMLERFWHPKMNWYGPSGIGTTRGIVGFRHWHQIPFLAAMPDRGKHKGQDKEQITYHFIAEGQYAAVTGWPNMIQTLSPTLNNGGGWLGIAASGQKISLRSLDFWRLENGKIRENWVLLDLLDIYAQIGVNVFARLREFNKARNLSSISLDRDY